MNFDWTDFLALAQELFASRTDDHLREAKLRSAVSRAYYAAFHHARAYYSARHGRKPPGSGSGKEHQLLPKTLMESVRRNERRAGHRLRQLGRCRRAADYRVLARPEDSHVSRSLHLAREIIDILQA